jgi:hypothetical protein
MNRLLRSKATTPPVFQAETTRNPRGMPAARIYGHNKPSLVQAKVCVTAK